MFIFIASVIYPSVTGYSIYLITYLSRLVCASAQSEVPLILHFTFHYQPWIIFQSLLFQIIYEAFLSIEPWYPQ